VLNPNDPTTSTNTPTLRNTPHRGVYLLPNSFTLAALFSAFYAIVQAMDGRFEHAAVAIFCSMVLDGMDGRVARMTNTQSAFGEQFDSLADMVSFGVAPALVMYEWQLKSLGKWGWLAAFLYMAGAAIRLARFNVNIKVVDKRFFQGLPSPAAAALLAGFVWLTVGGSLSIEPRYVAWTSFGLCLYAGFTMVSDAPFWSGKAIAFRKNAPVWALAVVAVLFALIAVYPAETLSTVFVIYGVSGYVLWLLRTLKRQSQAKAATTTTK
jgi:CDP-diacylglycerol---serine O-phosphatidyltransferase